MYKQGYLFALVRGIAIWVNLTNAISGCIHITHYLSSLLYMCVCSAMESLIYLIYITTYKTMSLFTCLCKFKYGVSRIGDLVFSVAEVPICGRHTQLPIRPRARGWEGGVHKLGNSVYKYTII